jgi:AcrR family transcriptional regulator
MMQPGLLDAVLGDGPVYDEDDAVTARVLDAALAEFLSYGLRRSTVEDITRRAKVGRMTLHRRFPSKQALIEAVFLREIRRVLIEVAGVIAQHDTLVDKLVEGLSFGVRRVSGHALFSRLLETDGEAMLPYLTVEAEALMVAATTFVARQITDAVGPGGSERDADYAAEAIIRFSHSVLLTPRGRFDLADDDELRTFMRAAITSLLAGVTDAG